jgi:hypothetical protein
VIQHSLFRQDRLHRYRDIRYRFAWEGSENSSHLEEAAGIYILPASKVFKLNVTINSSE